MSYKARCLKCLKKYVSSVLKSTMPHMSYLARCLVCLIMHDVLLTNRFQVAVRLFSNISQITSKCGKNKQVAHQVQPSLSLMFLPHFYILCDLLLNRRTATWNLLVLYNKELKKSFNDDVIYTSVLQWIINVNQSESLHNWAYYTMSYRAQCIKFLIKHDILNVL